MTCPDYCAAAGCPEPWPCLSSAEVDQLCACGRVLADSEVLDRDLPIAADALRAEASACPPDGYGHNPLCY